MLSKKRRQQLSAARAARKTLKKVAYDQSESDEEWIDDTLVPTAFDKLLAASQSATVWEGQSNRPLRYIGSGSSTLRRKRQKFRQAASGTKKLTEYFASTSSTAPNINRYFNYTTLATKNNKDDDDSNENNEDNNCDEEENDSGDEASQHTLETLRQIITSKPDTIDPRLQLVRQYLELVHRDMPKLAASLLIAESINKGTYCARLIRSWAKQYLTNGHLTISKRGRHQKVQSLLDDEDVKLKVAHYLREKKFNLTVSQFVRFLENEVLPSVGVEKKKTIAESTARNWLSRMGFEFKEHRKGVYIDGHERDDVVMYREYFLNEMEQLMRLCPSFDGVDMLNRIDPDLPPGERLHIIVTHDESIFHANDGQKHYWAPKDEQQLRPKGMGASIMVSEFLCETIGRLRLNEEEKEQNQRLLDNDPAKLKFDEACVIIEPGKNKDGWWTAAHVAEQLEKRAIPIFERTHPECKAIFLFDNSTNHNAFAPDALIAEKMNLNDGGKALIMRNGYMRDGKEQSMVLADGTPKGMRTVLMERGLWKNGLRRKCKDCNNKTPLTNDCCAFRILSLEPDFIAQKPLIPEIVERAGHLCLSYPKFHPELNFIESFWGAAKVYTRSHCDYTLRTLRQIVPESLNFPSLTTIRRYAQKSYRFMSAYKLGLKGKVANFVVKKYRSHRRVPSSILNEISNY